MTKKTLRMPKDTKQARRFDASTVRVRGVFPERSFGIGGFSVPAAVGRAYSPNSKVGLEIRFAGSIEGDEKMKMRIVLWGVINCFAKFVSRG